MSFSTANSCLPNTAQFDTIPYKQQPGNLMWRNHIQGTQTTNSINMTDSSNLTINENGSQVRKLKRTHEEAGLQIPVTSREGLEVHETYSDDDIDSCDGSMGRPSTPGPKPGKKTRGRVKISMEFIDNKLRRYTTFSKRKSGIMKKAHELATLTGTQVMLLVASETGHVYTFATRKLQPILSSEAGKQLIQTCLNSPDPPESTVNQNNFDEQRMSAQGFEEPDLTYAPAEETKEGLLQKTYHNMLSVISGQHTHLSQQQPQQVATVSATHTQSSSQEQTPMNLIAMNSTGANRGQGQLAAIHIPGGTAYTIMSGTSQQDQTRTIQLSPSEAQTMMRVSSTPSASNVLGQQTIVQQQTSLVQERLNEGHITLLSPYNTIQRQGPAVQQVLWAPALRTQPITVMHTSPQSEEKKTGSKR